MDLNDAVLDEQNWAANAELLSDFLNSEVFFGLVNPPADLQDGSHVAKKQELRMEFVRVENEPLSLFYTTKENPHLKGRIGGVPLRTAIKMVLGNPHVNGLLLQSDETAWVVVKKAALGSLLEAP